MFEEMEEEEFSKFLEELDDKDNLIVSLMIYDETGEIVNVVSGFKNIKKEVNSKEFKTLAKKYGVKI